jgi:hypothetical protein
MTKSAATYALQQSPTATANGTAKAMLSLLTQHNQEQH